MKTNVTLKSSDRDLFGIKIRQQTKTEMLSVTDLQKSYEKARWSYGWSERTYHTVMQSKDFQERLFFILKEQDFINLGIPQFMEMIKKESIAKVLKGLGVWKTTGRGENRMTVCNPYIWVLLALELNPMIYAKVIIWLTDSLVFDRIEAGTEFLPMNSAIKSIIEKPNYPEYSRTINRKVFGTHQRGIRDLSSSKQLRKISDIEKFVTNCINMKIVTNEAQLFTVINGYK